MTQSRQLAAIMFTDIVGYMAIMEADEERAFELLDKNRNLQRPIIENHGGKLLKEMGDGILASFPTITSSVYCALEIQKICVSNPDLELRIGIHQGEVVFDGNDVFGSGVNIASRLEPLAPIGGILVSESVHNNVLNKKGIISKFVGEKELKGVNEPVKVYQVHVGELNQTLTIHSESNAGPKQWSNKSIITMIMAVGILLVITVFSLWFFNSDSIEAKEPVKIAVLPFINDSSDGENQYFCNGMTDDIRNHLEKIGDLIVISRTAVEPYGKHNPGFEVIAEELGVSYILEGASQKVGDRFRLTAQLIDVSTGDHLWSDNYDGVFSDTIFTIQTEIAKKVASSVHAVITPAEEKSISEFPTTEIEAYNLLIQARQEMFNFFSFHDPRQIARGHKLLDKAISIDPNYIEAILYKGEFFLLEVNYDSVYIYAKKLIDIGEERPHGYTLMGEYYHFTRRFDSAISMYSTAIKLAPKGNVWNYVALARAYLSNNQPLEAAHYYDKSIEMGKEEGYLDYNNISDLFLNLGYYDKAEQYLNKSIEKGLGCYNIHSYSWLMLLQNKLGKTREFLDSNCQRSDCERLCYKNYFLLSILQDELIDAQRYFDEFKSTHEAPWSLDRHFGFTIAYVLQETGRTIEANRILTEQAELLLSKIDENNVYDKLALAQIYALRNERDEALKYLEDYATHGFNEGWQDFILIHPFFESLRDDPEFISIVKEAQEEKAAMREQLRQLEANGELTL